MSEQHTPGPWKARWHKREKQWNVFRPEVKGRPTYAIASLYSYGGEFTHEEMAANASLIAAAPELLAAVHELIEAMPVVTLAHCPAEFDRLRAAIAKAKGGMV